MPRADARIDCEGQISSELVGVGEMRRRRLAFVVGLAVLGLGCPAPPVTPSHEGTIINVEPGVIARGETRTIRIQGVDTDWTPQTVDTSTVTFGEGVVVQSINVQNDRNIFAEITADSAAPLGIREVKVGELSWSNVFEVAEFVQIAAATPLMRGGFFTLSLDGYHTEWSPSGTDVNLGDGVLISGQVLGRQVFTDVVDKERIDVFGFVDLFSTPGPRDVTVADVEERVLTGAIDVNDVTITTLAPNTQMNGNIATANTSAVYSVTSTFGRQLDLRLTNQGDTSAVGYLFSSSAGLVPVAEIVPGSPLSRIIVPTAGEQFLLGVFDDQLGGGATYDFQVRYDSTDLAPTAIAAGVPVVDQTLGNGEEEWWNFTTTGRWRLATVTVTPTAMGGGTLDPVLRVARQGPEPLFIDQNSGADSTETVTFLVGTQMTALFSVQDVDGNSNGMNSRHQVDYDSVALGTTLLESSETGVPIQDPLTLGSTAFTQSTLEVANSTILGNLHVALDIAHPDVGNLVIDLQSPMGTIVRLHDGDFPGQNGLLQAYLDLPNFNGEDAKGTWTLHVGDTVPGDAGLIRGWAISVP